jgi:hypothetical protein
LCCFAFAFRSAAAAADELKSALARLAAERAALANTADDVSPLRVLREYPLSESVAHLLLP